MDVNVVDRKDQDKSAFGSMKIFNKYGTTEWVFDSGSTDHITMNKKWINEYKDFVTPKDIKIGDGSITQYVD